MKKVDDSNLPMVSIITPTYNRKNFVKLMIYNFYSQNYPADKLEWIIVDDSAESIAGLLPNDSRLKYYHFGEDEKKALLCQIGGGSGGSGGSEEAKKKEKLPIGMKRNIGANLAADGAIIVHMDDDDYYPPNSVRIRVMALLSSGKECVSCSAIANFNIKRMISMINVPPYDMSYEKRVSEACLAYKKTFWEKKRYNNRAICSEAEDFIGGRTDEVVDTDWQGIVISLRHSGNMTNRNEMTEEPNGWHFGKIEDKLFLFLTSFDES
jgi:glycosyltransferase involved in cell wall biosynthesis